MKIVSFANKNAFGLRVGALSFWAGFSIDANEALRPIIRDIPIKRMTGFVFTLLFRRKGVQMKKWVEEVRKK